MTYIGAITASTRPVYGEILRSSSARQNRGRWGDVGIFAFKNINRTLKNTVTCLKYSAILHLQINTLQ